MNQQFENMVVAVATTILGVLAVLIASSALTGCASTGVNVTRTAPDGSTVTLEQKSSVKGRASMGDANNQLGATYTATAPDGTTVDLTIQTGHSVAEMESESPIAEATGLVSATTELVKAGKQ